MRRRILSSFVLILALLFTYVFYRIVAPLRSEPALFWSLTGVLAVGQAAILWLPLVYWMSKDPETKPHEIFIERIAHLAMGFMSLLLLFMVLRDFAFVALYPFGKSASVEGASASLAIVAVSIVFSLLGFLIARRGPVVRRISLSSGGEPLRLVQLSDLHVGTWIGRRYVEKVARQVRALGPIDFLILTGDIGDGDPAKHVLDLAPLGDIPARLGKFAVSGNHEGYWNEAAWNRRVTDLGFRMLENESVVVETPRGRVSLHGIPDAHADPERALATVRPEVFSVFLAHQPKHADAAIEAGVDLQLSGHTHAGQFLPWCLFIGFAHRFSAGLYRIGKTAIYVNSGTGFWGPPFRLGTLSETTLIEFLPR